MSVRKSLASSLASNYFIFGMNFLMSIAIARLMTPAELGVQALAVSATAFFAVLRDFGASAYLLQIKELDKDHLGSAVTVSAIFAVPLGLAMILCANPIAGFYHEPRLAPILRLMSITFFLLPIGTTSNLLLSRDMRFGLLATAGVLGALANFIVTLGLILSGFGVISIAIGIVTSAALSLLFLLTRAPETFGIRPSLKYVRAVLIFGWWGNLTSLVRTFGNQGNELYMGRVLGLYSLGIYSRAAALVNTFSITLTNSITSVSLAHFAALNRESKETKTAILKYCAFQGGVTWPFFLFIMVFARDIILLLIGPKWVEAIPIARILCMGWIVTLNLHSIVPSLLMASGRLRLYFWSQFVTYGSRLALVVIVAPIGGLIAVATVITLSASVLLFPYLYALDRYYDVKVRDVMRVSLQSAALTAIAIGPAAALRFFLLPSWLPTIVQLAIGGVVTGVSFLASTYILRHPLRFEMMRLLSPLLQRARREPAR